MWIYSYFCWLYILILCMWVVSCQALSKGQLAKPSCYVPEGYVDWNQSKCLLYVFPELFFCLEHIWFWLIKYFPCIFVWFLEKKTSWTFLHFTYFFLQFSTLLRALCLSLRSCQILSRPSFSSALAKRICIFKFLFFIQRSYIILWRLFFLTDGFFSLSPRKFSYRHFI